MKHYRTQLQNWKNRDFGYRDELPDEDLPTSEHILIYEDYCNQIAEIFGEENVFLMLCCDGDVYIYVKTKIIYRISFLVNLHYCAEKCPEDYEENHSAGLHLKIRKISNKLEEFDFFYDGNFEKCLQIAKFWFENMPSISYSDRFIKEKWGVRAFTDGVIFKDEEIPLE